MKNMLSNKDVEYGFIEIFAFIDQRQTWLS